MLVGSGKAFVGPGSTVERIAHDNSRGLTFERAYSATFEHQSIEATGPGELVLQCSS